MGILHYTYLIVGGLLSLFLILLVGSSISERRIRAVWVSLTLLVAFAVTWFGGYGLLSDRAAALYLPLAGLGNRRRLC